MKLSDLGHRTSNISENNYGLTDKRAKECLRKKKELEFYDLKLLNKNSSFVSIRPYQVIKEIQGRSGYYAASSNYLKKLSEGEFKFLNYIKKPKTLDSFFKEKISNINSSDKKNIIQALNEASIIYLYE